MTCIVGIEGVGEADRGKLYMGCDSSAAGGWDIRKTVHKKIFRNGPFLIGYTDSFRVGQLLEHSLNVESQGATEADMQYLVTTFIDALRNLLVTKGMMRTEDGVESGINFLLGYRGKLYEVHSDFQVNRYAQNYGACGAGRNYALGALHASEMVGQDRPIDAIKRALRAAAEFSNGVCGPFYVAVANEDGTVEWEDGESWQ